MAEFSGWRQQASNKNLLINPRFRVNQRGQTEYTGMGYCVDMWAKDYWSNGPMGSVKLEEDGILLNCERLAQIFEKPFSGEFTFSLKYEGIGPIISFFNGGSNNLNIKFPDEDGVKINSIAINVTFDRIIMGGFTKGTKLYAAKLEQGPISTLALDLMQPYTPQDYQRELMECQRYFVASYDNWLPMAAAIRGQGLVVIVPLNAPMRIKPSLSTNLISVFGEDGAWHEYEFSVQRVKDNVAILSTTIDGNYFIQGNSYLVKNLPALSAEL